MVSLCRSACKNYVIRFTRLQVWDANASFRVTSQRALTFGHSLYNGQTATNAAAEA